MVPYQSQMGGGTEVLQVFLTSVLSETFVNSNISKTSLMDPRFGPAWIAFGHTFAIEGEHDHAITAYSTSARLFQG